LQAEVTRAKKQVPSNSNVIAESAESSSTLVERWRNNLLHVVGCSPDEIAQRVGRLLRFCACEGISPEFIVQQCRYGADRGLWRKLYLGRTPDPETNRVLQSFLIHNGVNTFGEIVCMPATSTAVTNEQGTQWDLAGRARGEP